MSLVHNSAIKAIEATVLVRFYLVLTNTYKYLHRKSTKSKQN